MPRLDRLLATSSSMRITNRARRCFYFRSYGTVQEHDDQPRHDLSRHRNPVFASVLREGMPLLHETVEIIQKSPQSRQPFRIELDEQSSSKHDERKESPKFQYTLYHVRAAALQCLETNLVKKDGLDKTVGEWSVKGEPVDIVHVQLSSSLQHVTLYWTSKSNASEKAVDHILELQEVLNKRWTARRPNAATRMASSIQRYLISNNKWARAPAVRLEPAKPSMLYDLLTSEDNDKV